jgi:riboflavin synthase
LFTGLIQALGTVHLVDPYHLQVNCTEPSLFQGLAIGDSVAVDGACLTVETLSAGFSSRSHSGGGGQSFIVTVSPETLQRTTLAQKVQTGAPVNLEPALRVGDRLGGHFVTGHVDGMGQLSARDTSGSSWQLHFQAPPTVSPYLIPKGSIAVNGISLTVVECDPAGTWFTVAVIPHSFAQTNLNTLEVGEAVNLEADLLGKYTAKLLRLSWSEINGAELPAEGHSSPDLAPEITVPEITMDYLVEHGFG